ncbi:hypothetical protein [Burkholderia multivorans]|uniref:hypothetical protein n=1 Tax=Burkholderia multivorans TaxID=87883 RepID=UPI0014839212|nr:hypothetical protein [Burkholderia multivorans]
MAASSVGARSISTPSAISTPLTKRWKWYAARSSPGAADDFGNGWLTQSLNVSAHSSAKRFGTIRACDQSGQHASYPAGISPSRPHSGQKRIISSTGAAAGCSRLHAPVPHPREHSMSAIAHTRTAARLCCWSFMGRILNSLHQHQGWVLGSHMAALGSMKAGCAADLFSL